MIDMLPKSGTSEAEAQPSPHRLVDQNTHASAHLAALGELLQPPPIARGHLGRSIEGRSSHHRTPMRNGCPNSVCIWDPSPCLLCVFLRFRT